MKAHYLKQTLRIGVMAATLTACVAFAAPLGLPPVPVPATTPSPPTRSSSGTSFSMTSVSAAPARSAAPHVTTRTKPSPMASRFQRESTNSRAHEMRPPVINSAYFHTQFWDGREPTLEAQSAGPPRQPCGDGPSEPRAHSQDRASRTLITWTSSRRPSGRREPRSP